MRIGVVGYGTGGRNFHTPFIEAAEGVTLAGVVTRSPERRRAVAKDCPGVPTYDSLGDLLAAGVVLSVFHNRRWDADIRTLASVVGSGSLGTLWRVHSRFDQDDPATLEAGPGGGLLRDLGSHVVDQMLWLFGPVRSVYAHLDWVDLPDGRTDAGFTIGLQHTSGVASYVESSKVNHVSARELRAYGSEGSYCASGADVQAQAIFAGRRPSEDPDGWGYDARESWGVLATTTGERRVPSEQGRYQDFYTLFAAAARGDAEQPVPAAEGIRTLAVLDAARASAQQGRSVEIT